jgi:hypothetical protein
MVFIIPLRDIQLIYFASFHASACHYSPCVLTFYPFCYDKAISRLKNGAQNIAHQFL